MALGVIKLYPIVDGDEPIDPQNLDFNTYWSHFTHTMACSIGMNIIIIMLPVPKTMSIWPGSHWWTGLGSCMARETPCTIS